MGAVLGGLLVIGLGALLVMPGLRLLLNAKQYEDRNRNLRGQVEHPSRGSFFWNQYKWNMGVGALIVAGMLLILGFWMVLSAGN